MLPLSNSIRNKKNIRNIRNFEDTKFRKHPSGSFTNILFLHWQPLWYYCKKMYYVDFSPTVFFSSHFAYQTPSSLEPKNFKVLFRISFFEIVENNILFWTRIFNDFKKCFDILIMKVLFHLLAGCYCCCRCFCYCYCCCGCYCCLRPHWNSERQILWEVKRRHTETLFYKK